METPDYKIHTALDMILTGLVRLFDLYEYDPVAVTMLDALLVGCEANEPVGRILNNIKEEYQAGL